MGNNTDDNGNDVEVTSIDSSDEDDEMEGQEGEHESLDHAWDEGQSQEEEDEGSRKLGRVQPRRFKWHDAYFFSPFTLWRRDTTRRIWRRQNPSTVPKWGYICTAYQGLSTRLVKIDTFAELEISKETVYLRFEQVRIELRACIEGLGEQLVKEISFSL